MSAKDKILDRLSNAINPLALFELNIMGVSENAAATRLSEMAREGKVVGRMRKGTPYKEWSINPLTNHPDAPKQAQDSPNFAFDGNQAVFFQVQQ